MSLTLDRSTWKRVTFGDVATASKERCDPTDGSVDRYIAGEHMDTDELKIRRWGDVGDGYLGPAFHRAFHPGQVLYGSRRTYLRKVAIAEFDGVCANTTFVVESTDTKVLLPEFLPFLMTSEPFHAFAISESKGSVNPYVNWSDIARYELELPPLDDQKRIADLLWAVQRHRLSIAEAFHALAELSEVMFAARLGSEPLSTCRPVKDLLIDGPTNGKSAVSNDEGRGVPTLSISAIRNGSVVGGDSVKYVDVASDSVASFVLLPDDFLVVRGNGNKRLTGLGGLVADGLPEGCIYPDLLIRLRFDPATILPEFAATEWNAVAAHSRLLRHAKSSNGIWKVNGKDIAAHTLRVPSVERQRAILAELTRVRVATDALEAEMNAVESLKRVTLADVFGEAK